jgi:hypothetical protein
MTATVTQMAGVAARNLADAAGGVRQTELNIAAQAMP